MTSKEFGAVAFYMDDVAREHTADQVAPCSADEFWAAYKANVCAQHSKGEQHCAEVLELAGVREEKIDGS